MAFTRFCATFGLLVMAAVSVSFVSSHCDPVESPGEGDNKIPDYVEFFKDHFTLQLEMTILNMNQTNYVKHSHYVGEDETTPAETDAVTLHDTGTLIIYHYFPEQESYILQFEDACIEVSEEHPPYVPYGWYSEDAQLGKMYGPAAILRSTHGLKARYDGGDFDVDGIKCEKWYICIDEKTEINLYFSQRDAFDMPEKDMFQDDVIANRLPVMFETIPEESALHIRYSVVDFLPDLTRHSNIETPRGLSCEGKVTIDPTKKVPKVPSHFSLAEEVIVNPFIEGILFNKQQYLDKFEIMYSEHMSMVRIDITPPAEEKEEDQVPDKIIHDFNTGVQYSINRKYGKCNMDFIPSYSFDQRQTGMGGIPVMAGPNQIFHLDDTYAFVGDRDTRSLRGDLFTSTRTDIPDPEFEFLLNYPKAVQEYYFSQGKETGPRNSMLNSIPTRGDLFIYNKTDLLTIEQMMTINIYDAKEISFYSTDEYSVNECYDRYDDAWSTLYLFFPATDVQFKAEAANEYEFKHHVYFYLLEMGDISPTRIGSIDVMDGSSGWYSNTSDSDTIMAVVKLMDRAPYFFGFRVADEPMEVPGDEELGVDVFSEEGCAEACSLDLDIKCKSFHYCKEEHEGYHGCYLSESIGAQGPQTKNITCRHYIDSRENRTFDDLPSAEVDNRLRTYIEEKRFNFSIRYNKQDVIFSATEHFMFKTPDPLDPIRSSFALYKRDHTITQPDFELKMKDKSTVACESACLAWVDFDCKSIVHNEFLGECKLYADHLSDMNSTRFKLSLGNTIYSRSYLSDYKYMLGGISLNTTGPVFTGDSPEACAWECSLLGITDCNSFEFCWYGSEPTCHLHVETFIDVSDGGNYSSHQKCAHFEKKAEKIFTRYPNEGMPNKNHKLVAQLTGVSTCAKLCLEDSSETCQSYDFCMVCEDGDVDVCGDNSEGVNLCFIGDHHIGEPGLQLVKASHCEHYSRDLFGDQDYASWIAGQRKSQNPYTGGSMAGLAFGMIFLGILVGVGFLFTMAKFRPGTLPKSISLGEVSSGLPRSSGGKDASVKFGGINTAGGESDI